MPEKREDSIPNKKLSVSDGSVIAAGAFINFIGTVARLSKTFAFIIITRLFGAEIFGLSMLGWTIIDMLGKVGQFSLDKGLINFIPRYRKDKDVVSTYRVIVQALGISLTLSMLVATVLFFSASSIAENILNKPRLTGILQLLSIAMPLISLTTIIMGITKAHKIMKYDALIRGGIEPLILFGLACFLFYFEWYTYGIAAALVGSLACSMFLVLYIFTKFYSWKECFAHLGGIRLITPLTRFSLPVMGYELVYMLMIRIDVLMVGYFLSAAQLGVYVVAVEIALATKKVRQWFDPIFSPIVAELNQSQELNRLEQNLRLVTRWVLTIGLAVLCGLTLVGRELLGLLGSEFVAGFVVLVVLAISQIIYAVMGSGDIILIMSGRPYLNLFNTIFVVIVNFVFNLWFIPTMGILGAALGTLISFGLLSLIRLFEVYHFYRIHPLTWRISKPICAAALAFGAAFFVGGILPDSNFLHLIILPIIFLSGYLGILCLPNFEGDDLIILRRLRGHMPF